MLLTSSDKFTESCIFHLHQLQFAIPTFRPLPNQDLNKSRAWILIICLIGIMPLYNINTMTFVEAKVIYYLALFYCDVSHKNLFEGIPIEK